MSCFIDGLIVLDLHICDVEGRKKPKPKVVFSDDLELPILYQLTKGSYEIVSYDTPFFSLFFLIILKF